jgi:hypothetical protein
MQQRSWIGELAVVLLATLAMGCPGRLTDPGRFTGGISNDGGTGGTQGDCDGTVNVEQDVFAATCATAGCHTTAAQSSSLDLETPGIAARMLNKAAVGCSNQVLLKSDLTGYFFNKLSTSPQCGSPMPLGKSTLTDNQVACVKQYLADELDGGTP